MHPYPSHSDPSLVRTTEQLEQACVLANDTCEKLFELGTVVQDVTKQQIQNLRRLDEDLENEVALYESLQSSNEHRDLVRQGLLQYAQNMNDMLRLSQNYAHQLNIAADPNTHLQTSSCVSAQAPCTHLATIPDAVVQPPVSNESPTSQAYETAEEELSNCGDSSIEHNRNTRLYDGVTAGTAERTPQKPLLRAKLPDREVTRRFMNDQVKGKRKRSHDAHGPSAEQTDIFHEASRSLSTVSSTPKIPPLEIYNTFSRLNCDSDCGFDDRRCLLLTRLFFAIGSPDAICQLREALHASRTTDINLTSTTSNISDSVRVLDRLDVTIHLYAMLKRFHLVSLCQHRDNLLAETRVTRSEKLDRYERVDVVVHRKMMLHAYPGLKQSDLKPRNGKDEYSRQSRALSDRFVAGQRWSMLTRAFAPGILALVPIQGDYRLSNSEYVNQPLPVRSLNGASFEKLPSAAIAMLIDVLKLYRGPFLQELSACVNLFASTGISYPFESEDADILKQEEYDSVRLIELCKADAVISV